MDLDLFRRGLAIPHIAIAATVSRSLRLSSWASVILVHPAKAVGRDDMPFGWDTRVVPSNTVLDTGSGLPTGRGDLGVGTHCQNLHCKLRLNRHR